MMEIPDYVEASGPDDCGIEQLKAADVWCSIDDAEHCRRVHVRFDTPVVVDDPNS